MPRVQHPAGVTPEDLCKCDKPRLYAFSGQAVKSNFEAFQNQDILLRLARLNVRGIYFLLVVPCRVLRHYNLTWLVSEFILGQFTRGGRVGDCAGLGFFPLSLQLCSPALWDITISFWQAVTQVLVPQVSTAAHGAFLPRRHS